MPQHQPIVALLYIAQQGVVGTLGSELCCTQLAAKVLSTGKVRGNC